MGAREAVRLKAIRRQMGWTRKEAARILCVSIACILRVERAEQDIDKDMRVRLQAVTGAKTYVFSAITE